MIDRRLTFEQFQVMSPAIYANFIPANTAGLISDSGRINKCYSTKHHHTYSGKCLCTKIISVHVSCDIWFSKSFFFFFRYGCHCMQNGEWVCTAAKTDECLKSKGQKSLLVPYRNFFFILWIPANKSNSISIDFALSPTLTPSPFLHPVTLANSCHSRLILYRF